MPRAWSMRAAVRPPIPPPTTIAFMVLLRREPVRTRQREIRARARLRPDLQLVEISPIPHAVPEDLVAAGRVLRRAGDRRGAVPRGRFHREERIDEVRAAESHEICAAGGQN